MTHRHLILGGLGFLVLGCQKPVEPKPTLAGIMDLDYFKSEVIEDAGGKRLRVTVTPSDDGLRRSEKWQLKFSRLYHRDYEPIEALPLTVSIPKGGSWQQDFTFPASAWEEKPVLGLPDVEYDFSGTSPNGSLSHSTCDTPAPGFSWSDSGADIGIVTVANVSNRPARLLEVRITSIKRANTELLKSPLQWTLKPEEGKVIPGNVLLGPMTVKYATRLVPNKRWALLSIELKHHP